MQATAPNVVYGMAGAARTLDISVTYLRLLIERGVAAPSLRVGGMRGEQKMFTRGDLEAVAVALGRRLPPESEAA